MYDSLKYEYVRVCLIRNSDTSATFVHMYVYFLN